MFPIEERAPWQAVKAAVSSPKQPTSLDLALDGALWRVTPGLATTSLTCSHAKTPMAEFRHQDFLGSRASVWIPIHAALPHHRPSRPAAPCRVHRCMPRQPSRRGYRKSPPQQDRLYGDVIASGQGWHRDNTRSPHPIHTVDEILYRQVWHSGCIECTHPSLP